MFHRQQSELIAIGNSQIVIITGCAKVKGVEINDLLIIVHQLFWQYIKSSIIVKLYVF